MKIIKIDNFGREYISDQLIAENVVDFYAKIIVEALNKRCHDNSPDYFIVVADDYELFEFKP